MERRHRAVAPTNSELAAAKALLQSSTLVAVRGAGSDEQPGTIAWRHRAVANSLLTSYLRAAEAPMYRKRDPAIAEDGLPRYCIALSGGGMRALAFATGVLHGLQERGAYNRAAVLSAVSGGGYASYWLAANVHPGADGAQSPAGAAGEQLNRLRIHSAEFMSLSTKAELLLAPFSLQSPLPTEPHLWQSVVSLVAHTVSGGESRLTELRWGAAHSAYSRALQRMLGGNWKSPVSADRLHDLATDGHVPVLVWLATARPRNAAECEPGLSSELAERARSLAYAAFEIGPTQTGSERLGFLSHMLMAPIDATAVSGAGMSIPFEERCVLLHMVDASVVVEDYPPRSNLIEAQDRRRGASVGPWFQLTDGGIADDLAVFPLVRRLCADIIVVDAEFDPYLIFEGYGYLKQQLAKLDIRLDVPGVEAVANRTRIPTAPSNPEVPCKDGICLIRPRTDCVRGRSSGDCPSSDHLATAVYEGELGPIPFATLIASANGEQQWSYTNRVSKVHYIKLSLDAAHIDQYPKTVRGRYASHADRRTKVAAPCVATRDNGACTFPHEPTARLDYSDGGFEAYWDLGRCVVERNWPDPTTGLTATRCSDSFWSDRP